MNYYVYVYLDTRKPGVYVYDDLRFEYEPIYVGKGKKRRYKNHLSLRNNLENYFYNKLNKMINEGFEPMIIILKDDMSEDESFSYEIDTIKKIGRIIDKTGPLTNLTNGGEGSSGRICLNETRIKISVANNGEKNGMFNKIHPMRGKTFDEFFGFEKSTEIKKLIKKNSNPSWKDKKLPKEMKDKISNTLKEWFKNNKHPMLGKHLKDESKKQISKTLIQYYKENPKIVSEETRHKQSLSASGSNNSSFRIYKIKNLETLEILTFNGSDELKNFITNFKKEKGLGKTNPPSFNLLIKGENNKYFSLIDKYYPNRKN